MTQLAVIRMATVLLLWADWMGPLRPVHHLDQPALAALAAVPWLSSPLMLVGFGSRWAAGLTGAAVLVLTIVAGHLQGVAGGGVPLDGLEAFWIGLLCLGLAFSPCGAALSVDAVFGRDPGPELGGRWLLRALPSALGVGLVIGHAEPVWWDGTRVEQLVVARYGAVPGFGPVWTAIAAIWRSSELGLAVAPWVRVARRPAFIVGCGVAGAMYVGFYVGTFAAMLVVLLLAAQDPEVIERLVRGRPVESDA